MVIRLDRHSAGEKPINSYWHDCRCLVGSARGQAVIIALALGALAGCSDPQSAESAEQQSAGSPLRTRLLTADQYTNSIAQLFGEDIAESILPPIPPMARTDGLLASGSAFVGVTSDQVSQIQQTAASIAAQVVDQDHRDFLIPCSPEETEAADTSCAALFLEETGRLLFRRPLSESRLSDLVQIADYAAEQTGDFYDGLSLALEAMLISPDFIFIADRAEADPDAPSQQRLDAYSLASRLSFLLWNAPPDDVLLQEAEAGILYTQQGLAGAVDRMLGSARLESGVRAFFDDLMAFDEFNSLAKDPLVYPMVTGTTLDHAREQTLRTIVDHLVARQADYRDLFTTRQTFMSMQLAAVYDTPAGQGWGPFEFEEEGPRLGLLTHVSFLAANSHSVRSSPTLRGKALRETFLCQRVPDPPPDVDFSSLEEAEDAATAKERLAVHNTNPSCAGCHLITDPMGLSLENFDGAGRFRETENGAPLDIAGELDGIFYEDIAGLAHAIRNHPKLSACLINRLYAYGTGGPVSLRKDRDTLAEFEARFAKNGYKLPTLLRDIALSDAFSRVRSEESRFKMPNPLRIKAPAERAESTMALPSMENE
ncbi:MAG: hypothetical protein CBC67_09370 [Gammaproteobacteria bacterium TMED107]|nr:hypothetical protein [Gammaproteobacteria bacterium]OUX72645.1 MAG: hypothetical protein CBC67_09370 [Gammaproteobacteria bacterium TMED107]